eukprot:TRINITY_DN6712_c0_g1_i3.p2 TRINITY_DN6712_c0_g1~~TRINITY_DN6712_c0_g1_i3.p2  ORF type:complete len:104 (+),score=18.88 TRINITY_DN6712_c0_g1_i3:619-930(+)
MLRRNNATLIGQMKLLDVAGSPAVDQWSVRFFGFGKWFYMDMWVQPISHSQQATTVTKMWRVSFIGDSPGGRTVVMDFDHWDFDPPSINQFNLTCSPHRRGRR